MSKTIPDYRPRSPLGFMRAFQRDPLELMTRLHREFGPIVQTQALPGLRVVCVAGPEHVRDVLVTHAAKIEKPAALKRVFRSSFGNGLFFSEGDFWKRQRKLASPAFHHVRIQGYAERMLRHIEATLDGWHGVESIPLRRHMSALTLSIVVDAIFRSDVHADTNRIYEAMHQLGGAISQQSVNPALAALPDWFPHPVIRRKREASRVLDSILYQYIDQRRAAGTDDGDLLASLIFAEDAETGERMSDLQVHDEAMTLFIAGHETSAVAISAAFALLAQHPAIEAKLHAELDSVLGGRMVRFDDLTRLPYTAQIIKEVMRLYPPAWILLRTAKQPVPAGDYAIPKGALIFVTPYATHRDPALYPDPEAFNPDRWTPAFEDSLPRGAFIPFGAGPRICIGNGFATMELHLILATLASRYRLTLPPDYTLTVKGSPTLEFGDIPVTLHQRTPQPETASVLASA